MSTTLSAGLGLKPQHYEAALRCRLPGLWFEVHAENYMVAGGPRLRWLEAIRRVHPLSLHGVSLSLAGTEPLDAAHLRRLAQLVERFQPALVSEHLAWSGWDGRHFPDLLPFARTGEALRRIAGRIAQTQDALGLRIAVENPSHYLRIAGHEWDEIDFLAELAARTGCGLLLDVNNVHVSARNLGFDAGAYVDRFPAEPVLEVHLAGHSMDPSLGANLLVDSHDAPVAPQVWALYRRLTRRIGERPTLIERDGNVPEFDELIAERNLAATQLDRANEANVAVEEVAP
jgi:uncharacterized protein